MRLVQRPCRKLAHSQCYDYCWCWCHREVATGRFYGAEHARLVEDGEDRGAVPWSWSWEGSQPGRATAGEPWRWWHTVLSVPVMLRVRRFRRQSARSIARER